jgi:acyl carrier protein
MDKLNMTVMDKTQIDSIVRDFLSTALGRAIKPQDDVQLANESGWDSIKHVELMFMLEETFGIVMDPDDFTSISSIEECTARVVAHLEAQRT